MSMGPLLTMRRARQLEVVHRAVTLGLNAAAAQLSAFVGQPITIEAPRLGLCAIDDLVACALGSAFEEAPACDAEVVMTGIYLGMGGDVTGHVVLLLAPADARALVAPLIADLDPPADRREDLLLSALGEVGNITASGLLNALADAARLRIGPSCPAVVTDMAGAILELPLLDIAQFAEEALYIETTILMNVVAAPGVLALIPRPAGLDALIRGLTAAEAKGGRR
jgi:chemotaxis protein CheC